MITPKIQMGLHGSSTMRIKSAQVAANFHFDGISNGIVSTLEMFNRHLYYGFMHKDVFIYQFYLAAKDNLIKQLINIDDLSEDQLRNLAFCMYMVRTANHNKRWTYPALLNRDPAGRIQQITGNTRAFTSMIVHDRPWEMYPILLAEHPDFDPSVLLNDPIKIKSDQQLNEILGLDYVDDLWDARVHVNFRITPVFGELWCQLDYIGDGTYHDHNPKQGWAFLEEYQKWRKLYLPRPKLKIYTQWPDLLINSIRTWDVEIAGTSEGMLIDDRLGYAERTVHAYHQSPTYGTDHVLWVVKPRPIDLSSLLLWVDATHTTYISNDWHFLLYRPAEEYKNTFINVNRPQN